MDGKEQTMIGSRKRTFGCVSMFMLLVILALAIGVDADDKRHRRRDHKHGESLYGEKKLKPISNAAYADQCGACHFAYQPELLPAAAWGNILEGIYDHFGASVALDEVVKSQISNYLTSNAADTSSAKLAGKIMRCLGSSAPARITEIPWIRKEHHEITSEVLQRKSVGSLANCIACHRTAASGEYDDDNISIPD